MTLQNRHGLSWSGATADEVKVLDDVIDDYFAYRLTAFSKLKDLCQRAPEFAMAHLLKGYLLLSMGTQGTIPAAKTAADHVETLRDGITENEVGHLSALLAWSDGDTSAACQHWDRITIEQPHDLLAIKLQHFTLFWLGRPEHMRDTIARVKGEWDDAMPGYANLLGMQSFALEEMGEYLEAERLGRLAVEMEPNDLWAVHAVAHVYEMQNDLDAGISWLSQPVGSWHDRNPFKEHLWWHTALFAFERGSFDRVLALFDSSIWPDTSNFYLDIQNAASILVRLEFAGVDVGDRWSALAEAAQERNGDHVLLFTEPHYTMAFCRTEKFEQAAKQLASLETLASSRDDLMGKVANELALPICKAIKAFYRKDYGKVVELLWPLRYQYQPIGGSHAQRDIFNIFLIEAAIGMKDFKLAKALLTERTARHKNSESSWRRLDEVYVELGQPPPERPTSIQNTIPAG